MMHSSSKLRTVDANEVEARAADPLTRKSVARNSHRDAALLMYSARHPGSTGKSTADGSSDEFFYLIEGEAELLSPGGRARDVSGRYVTEASH